MPHLDIARRVSINGLWYDLAAPVEVSQLGIFIRKFTVGDAKADSDDYQSSLIYTDFSGGIGIEDSDEGADTTRFWFGIADTRSPRMVGLPPLVSTATAGSGTCYPIGVVGTQFYAAFGIHAYGWKSDNTGFSATDNNIAYVPVGKSTAFDGRVYIPQGTNGCTYVTESAAATQTLTDSQLANPKAVSFATWANNLYALCTDGTLWKLVQGGNPATDWAAVTNSAAATLTLNTSETPKTLISYFDRSGAPTLWAITDRAAYMFYESAVEWRPSNIQFPPHPDFGRAAAVWRPGEDLWIAAASDVVRQTSANAVVPLSSGISRDQGVPQQYAGTIVDLAAEVSNLYALVGGTSTTSTSWAYAAQVGAAGSGNGQFSDVTQIAVDSSGNVFAADFGNDRIQKFTATPAFDSVFKTTLDEATGLCIDSSNNVYVTFKNAASDYRIRKYTSAGTLQWTTSATAGTSTPGALATDGTHVYATHPTGASSAVSKWLASTGAFVSSLAAPGTGNGQFTTPYGIAYSSVSGTLFVVDQGNDRVQELTTSGTFVRKWGSSGTGSGQFGAPSAVVCSPTSGNVFVTDVGNDTIQEFTSSGAYIRTFGASGTGDGQIQVANGIAINATGTALYVSDLSVERIQRFNIQTSISGVTSYPSLQAWTGVGWHSLWELPSTAYNPTWLYVSAPTTHYRLWWGMDDGNAYYLALRRGFENVNQAFLRGTQTFATSGYVLTSKFDAGMLGFDKVASHVTVFPRSATTTETITIEFNIDNGGWESLGSVTTSDRAVLSFGDLGRLFNSIQFRISFARGTTTTLTPLLQAMTLLFVKIPQNARSMVFTVKPTAADHVARSGKTQFIELDDLNAARTFFDVIYRDTTYTHCRIAGIKGQDNTSDLGGIREVSIIQLPTGAA